MRSAGNTAGNIIAIIMTIHMPRKVPAAPAQVWPGMRIHAIDMVQPPGISMPGIADMEPHQATVTAALPRNSSAVTPKKARSDAMAQALPYSSWRFHQTPCSLRPSGARSSHWYMPHRPSSPRA